MPLPLDPYGSVFVVFRHEAKEPSRAIAPTSATLLTTVEGPWTVGFPLNWGAPPQITLERLASWTESPEAGVRHFSGTATYTKDVEVEAAWLRQGAKLVLDLGDVRGLAEVSVNGKPVGILWTPPFRADVTGALRAGRNRLEIKVTNPWTNRMIGDQELPREKRYTFSTYDPYDKTSPFGQRTGPNELLTSGLLGPVTVSSLARP